jgi:hypothetical protein
MLIAPFVGIQLGFRVEVLKRYQSPMCFGCLLALMIGEC